MDKGFSEISKNYENISHVQQASGQALMGLLGIHGTEDVLDLGCGAGNLTRKIRARTAGLVYGMDPSAGMVREAMRNAEGIAFEVKSAEEMDCESRFDVVFCNSAMQWFKDSRLALKNIFRALKPGGRVGVQSPAKADYCPNFTKALQAVRSDPRTAAIFPTFVSPWFFMETAEEYAALFRDAGFTVRFSWIRTVRAQYLPDQVFEVFLSGASRGYLGPEHYPGGFSAGYSAAFLEIVRKSFIEQAGPDGTVELVFNRIFVIADKR